MKKTMFKYICLIIFLAATIIPAKVYAMDKLDVNIYLEYTKSFSIDKEIDSKSFKINDLENKNNNQVCMNEPESGNDARVLDIDKDFEIIDSKDGWYLISIEDNLYLINLQNFIIDEEGKACAKEKLILNEGKEMCILKKGQQINVLQDKSGYLKIKMSDGFEGWVNKKSTKAYNGIVTLIEDAKAYYSMEYVQMNIIKNLEKGESINKLAERDGYILLEKEGRLSWISKDRLNVQGKNIFLKDNVNIYEAASDYTYKALESINVIDGSNKELVKVLTPKGNQAWIKRENLSYDNSGKLVCIKDTKAYYTGNLEGNSIREKGGLMADIAFKEVGYREGENNKTKYGDWYGLNAEWCGIFVSWCSFSAGISEDIVPKSSYCKDSAKWFMDNKKWYPKNQYKPKKGDIIYFYVNGDINHIGIVYEVTEDSVITIEGNMSDKVLQMSYKLNDKRIAGYGSPTF